MQQSEHKKIINEIEALRRFIKDTLGNIERENLSEALDYEIFEKFNDIEDNIKQIERRLSDLEG